DIFTMGARPIALLNSLRFGPLDDRRNARLLEGVVAGIAGYGNSIGIPTVGGEIAFEEPYSGNPLVNVLCVGVAKADALVKGSASGAGNPVYYVGAKTGRDGIHGATMASAAFDAASEERRPTVQAGDPFAEKLVLEATLEILAGDAVVGIQDMGAAGLTCGVVEMSHKGGCGIELDLDRVPQRETGMTPYELMLSESQERMLLVAKAGREDDVAVIARRWGLCCEVVGRVIAERRARVRWNGEVVADLPTALVVDEAPRDEAPIDSFEIGSGLGAPLPCVTNEALLARLSSATTASKDWVYRQYDHTVRAGTVVPPGAGDAGVVRIPGTRRAFAVAVGDSVNDAAIAVACVGAEPVAITNCLNFGSPKDRAVLTGFAKAVAEIGAECRALGIPVTGGNVSFYNETDGVSIPPTPVIGMLGVIEDLAHAVTASWKAAGDEIALVSAGGDVARLIRFMSAGARARLIASAHDVGDDGLEVALAESCLLSRGLGATVRADWPRPHSSAEIVVSYAPSASGRLTESAMASGVELKRLGKVGGDRLIVNGMGGAIDVTLPALAAAWRGAIPALMGSAR
ncbi:MAG: phosphoribosylformylglycinamidine synthase subunit PurL, partial [Deltaproteobacteria bacterium]|nr:phosphoribosylformylglycinamidine synthase subunit PurL [Deltaproteobacteria bacterium]